MEDKTIVLNGISYKLVPIAEEKKDEKKEETKEDIEEPILKDVNAPLSPVPIIKEAEQTESEEEEPKNDDEEESEPEEVEAAERPTGQPLPTAVPMVQAKQPKLQKVTTTTIDGTRIYEYKRPRVRKDKDGNDIIVYSTIRRVYTPHQRNGERRIASDNVINYMKHHIKDYEETGDMYDWYCKFMLRRHQQKPYAYNSFIAQFRRAVAELN